MQDAFPSKGGLLLHQHDDLDRHFPKAEAREEAGDNDPPDNSTLHEKSAGRRQSLGS